MDSLLLLVQEKPVQKYSNLFKGVNAWLLNIIIKMLFGFYKQDCDQRAVLGKERVFSPPVVLQLC